MKLIPTPIAGCHRVQLQPILDARGSFTAVFDLSKVRTVDPDFSVLRVNRSFTRQKGAIRGIHFQRPPMDEAKLVQCLQGAIFDVCVDLRPDSPTYLQWAAAELTPENQELLLIPKGCGHGFQTLVEDSLIEYLVTATYSPPHEGGMRWDDPALGIRWPLPCSMTSERDAAWPLMAR